MKQFINPVYSHQGANQLVYLHRFGTCAIRYSWAQIAHVQGRYQWWTRIRQSVSYAYDQHCFDIVGGDGYVTDVPRLASSQTGLSFPFQILTAPIRSPAWLIRAMCWTGGWSRIWIHPVICINLLHFFLKLPHRRLQMKYILEKRGRHFPHNGMLWSQHHGNPRVVLVWGRV